MYPGTLNNFVYSQWSIYRHTVKFEIYFLILDLTLSIVEVTNKIRMILLFLSDYYYFFFINVRFFTLELKQKMFTRKTLVHG